MHGILSVSLPYSNSNCVGEVKNFPQGTIFPDGEMLRSRLLINHYQTLGVGYRATPSEIKAAFRNLAKQYHPDQNPDDPSAEKLFRGAKEAYECLSNKIRRAEYDRDWIQTGRATWVESSHASSSSGQGESETPGLSQRELIVLYSLVIGLPVFASLTRNSVETSKVQSTHRQMGSWTEQPPLPEQLQSDEVVEAFFNPISRHWERIPPGYSLPTPLELMKYIAKERKGLHREILSRQNLPIPSRNDKFEIRLVPERVTSEASIIVEMAGECGFPNTVSLDS